MSRFDASSLPGRFDVSSLPKISGDVRIPDGVTKIERSNASSEQHEFQSLYIPASVTEIAPGAFRGIFIKGELNFAESRETVDK